MTRIQLKQYIIPSELYNSSSSPDKFIAKIFAVLYTSCPPSIHGNCINRPLLYNCINNKITFIIICEKFDTSPFIFEYNKISSDLVNNLISIYFRVKKIRGPLFILFNYSLGCEHCTKVN